MPILPELLVYEGPVGVIQAAVVAVPGVFGVARAVPAGHGGGLQDDGKQEGSNTGDGHVARLSLLDP